MNEKDLIETVKKLEKLSPFALNMEVYKEGYFVLNNNFKHYSCSKFSSIYGIEVIVKDDIKNVNKDECKINFSDGSFIIQKIFTFIND